MLDQRQCRKFFGEEKSCTLYFNFCENIKDVSICANSTVCLTDGSTHYKFGQYIKYGNPFAETSNLLLSKVMCCVIVSLQGSAQTHSWHFMIVEIPTRNVYMK